MVCYNCGTGCEIKVPPEELAAYRSYHPVCEECGRMGKAPRVVRKPQNTTNATATGND